MLTQAIFSVTEYGCRNMVENYKPNSSLIYAFMETGDKGKCDPKTRYVFSSLSRNMLIHKLPTLSPVSIIWTDIGMKSTGY